MWPLFLFCHHKCFVDRNGLKCSKLSIGSLKFRLPRLRTASLLSSLDDSKSHFDLEGKFAEEKKNFFPRLVIHQFILSILVLVRTKYTRRHKSQEFVILLWKLREVLNVMILDFKISWKFTFGAMFLDNGYHGSDFT